MPLNDIYTVIRLMNYQSHTVPRRATSPEDYEYYRSSTKEHSLILRLEKKIKSWARSHGVELDETSVEDLE